MGRTLTEVRGSRSVHGNEIEVKYDVAFDATYVANGEAFTPRQVGLKTIVAVDTPGTLPTGHSVYYDRAGNRLKVLLVNTTVAEVAGGTNLAALTGIRLKILGW